MLEGIHHVRQLANAITISSIQQPVLIPWHGLTALAPSGHALADAIERTTQQYSRAQKVQQGVPACSVA